MILMVVKNAFVFAFSKTIIIFAAYRYEFNEQQLVVAEREIVRQHPVYMNVYKRVAFRQPFFCVHALRPPDGEARR